jgi:phospholipid transport system transporter-binding protein
MNAALKPAQPLALPEQVTMQTAAQALLDLQRALSQQEGPELAIDAQGLRVFDSSAVAVLLELRRQAQAKGQSLSLRLPPQRLRDLVALYGVSELLPA